MFFGDGNSFSINVEISERGGLDVRLQIYLRGISRGDWNVSEHIGTYLANLSNLSVTNVVPEDIFKLPADVIIRQVVDAYYGDASALDGNYFSRQIYPGEFLFLTGSCAAFDDELIILVIFDGMGRFIWREADGSACDLLLDKEKILLPIIHFIDWGKSIVGE